MPARSTQLISAFLGISGRTDATHAALLLANAYASLDRAVTLVRITALGDAPLSTTFTGADAILLVEMEAKRLEDVTPVVAREIKEARQTGRNVVLDLPVACLVDPGIRSMVDVRVVSVGPAPLDEQSALALLEKAGHILAPIGCDPADAVPDTHDTISLPWLLGCGRSGGDLAAFAFERAMADGWIGRDGPEPRVLPVTVPTLSRAEAAGLIDGGFNARMLRAGLLLLASLRIVRGDPASVRVDPGAIAAALGVDGADAVEALIPDGRLPGDRLRDLADELEAIRDGVKPTPADLRDAPVLEGWRIETAKTRVLAGRVHGHPDFPAGRPVTTSDLYASDGKAWARTLSRYYRLGAPAKAPAKASAH